MKPETMKTTTLKRWRYIVPVVFILAGIALFYEARSSPMLFAAIGMILGFAIATSFAIDYKWSAREKPLTRGQRALFVLCGAVMAISGALRIWELM